MGDALSVPFILSWAKYDMENFVDRSVCYAPHGHECSHSRESELKPLGFITFFFSICFKLQNMLTSIYVKLLSS